MTAQIKLERLSMQYTELCAHAGVERTTKFSDAHFEPSATFNNNGKCICCY